MADLTEEIKRNSYDIQSIKQCLMTASIDSHRVTEALQGLTTQMAISNTQYKQTSKSIELLERNMLEHSIAISDMRPTVNALRGLMWKMIGGGLTIGVGVASIVIAATKFTS